ncbi:MAG: ABC transporter substrate-binding protein [Planctomycetes bacterium]|nr:ABC transporter substrate-binding protein [Planctomycetota bacterium]
MRAIHHLPLLALLALAASCGGDTPSPGAGAPSPGPAPAAAPVVLRVGHFPNVTHVQGLVAHALTRQGKGWFEERLGPGARVEWFVYNAGPSAMEALLAGSIDLTYVGPNPAINAHARSAGAEVRVLAGAARGGAALVVAGDGRIAKREDFRGRRVATPQLGNTQDVACRAWLLDHGFRVTPSGGDVQVIPTANPDMITLLQSGGVDAAWTVEPWVSRLVAEAGAKVLLEEEGSLTTILTCSAAFLARDPASARRFAQAHGELTAWVRDHPAEAKALVLAELKAETGRPMPADLLDRCWPRLRFDVELARGDFDAFAAAAVRAGTAPEAPDLSRLVQVLR